MFDRNFINLTATAFAVIIVLVFFQALAGTSGQLLFSSTGQIAANINLTMVVSGLSLSVAIVSLVMTYRQRQRQDKLALRKAMTDLIAEIVKANIEFTKQPYGANATAESMETRRQLNEQRRYLANHADLLAKEIPEHITDIDCNIIARAFAIQDTKKADKYWQLCLQKSSAAGVRAMNLRAFARHLYATGRLEEGGRTYESSIVEMAGTTDRAKRSRSETYSLWAIVERDFGSADTALSLFQLAKTEANSILGVRERTDMEQYLSSEQFTSLYVVPTN